MTEFFAELLTWKVLLTVGGATVATGIFTQIIKSVLKLQTRGTRVASAVIGAIILVLATFFAAEPTPSNLVLAVLNGIILGWLTNGAYDNLVRKEAGP